MSTTDPTIGDALPDYLKSDYPSTVLDVPLSEAVQIAVYNEPPTSGLSEDDIESIIEIFQTYQSKEPGSDSGGSAYWNKTPDENSAYWNKQ